jgi:hypothetical protein
VHLSNNSHSSSSSSSTFPTAPSSSHLVNMLAVVAGVTAPQEVTHSARYNCPACGSSIDVLAEQQYLPCCNVLKSPTCEDLTGRCAHNAVQQ